MTVISNKSTIRNCAEFGSSVLLDINDGDKMTFARLHSTSTLKIGSARCTLEALVGEPFGAVFELQSERNTGKLVRLPSVSDSNGTKEKDQQHEADQNSEEVGGRDNRALVDDNRAQTLSSDDIDRMKRGGASGKEIIEALVANSASFETKTAFSQEKYMKKKQKKYAPRVLLRRPSARRIVTACTQGYTLSAKTPHFKSTICEAYFIKDPRKIGFCRMDTLALMMSLANVGPKSDVLVLESLGGLITAAVAERVGGHGSICSTYYTTKRPPIDMVRLLNLDDATALSVLRAPLSALVAARQSALGLKDQSTSGNVEGGKVIQFQIPEPLGEPKVSSPGQDVTECVTDDTQSKAREAYPLILIETSGSKDMDVDQEDRSNATAEDREDDACEPLEKNPSRTAEGEGRASKAPRPGNEATSSDVLKWASQGFSSLLLAAQELDPWPVIQKMLPLLSSSSPFVIYSQYQQPLAECMYQLQKNNMAVAIQLIEPWCREYQVLPLRSHPHMQMSATGGFTLSGIKITSRV